MLILQDRKGLLRLKVVILAGGFGTRISEESHLIPKPMIEIGGMPILWHIMKYYASYGFDDFIILAGYKQYVIKEFFADYFLHNADISFDLANNKISVLNNMTENWKVAVIDTGLNTMTGGRIKRVEKYIDEDTFMLTYGDGVADVDLEKLLKFHQSHGKIATITTVSIAQNKGVLSTEPDGSITSFREKDDSDEAIVNGGFMVLNKEVFSYIDGDNTTFERETVNRLVDDKQLMGYYHPGFWQCMDTQREKKKLEELWENGIAPWKRW